MNRKSAMISSTSIDLPVHRREVVDACLREGIFPIGMEHLPARDADAIRVSLEMVDKADIYIGIFAWRYGHKPEGHDSSITEMEFNRAVDRNIPILVFLIHKEHPLTIEMVEADKDAQKKLEALKERASKGRGRSEFKSPEDLRGGVVHALSDLKHREQEKPDEKAATEFHPPNLIPKSPEAYIAHPYSLLQTKDVVGRQAELNLLTDWVTSNKQVPAETRIFNLVAIGGMGKSALTWKWFDDIVPNELPNLAGRMWWSFYESDAHYENFVIRALAYVSGQSEKDVREMKSPDREDQLWRILDQQPYLLVLDGLERILLAYARMDAARMLDDDLDEQTDNRVAKAIGLPVSAVQSFVGKHQLRCTADHRAGQFLRRLARVKQSRILVTTRLYPAELQTDTGHPLPGCFAVFLGGLKDDDALNLWRAFKVSGSREQLLPLFRSFDNYPLLLRALAGEVAEYKPAPGDFDQWRNDNPGFNPAGLPLKNAKTHVLEYALRGLGDSQRQVLHTLAAFRMPGTWETLRALLAGTGKLCSNDRELDVVLTELEDRGLVGWDKKANRYDLHPIVRGVVWEALGSDAKQGIYRELHTYFDAVPRPPEWDKVERVEDLTPAVELFDKLIGLDRYEDAFLIFRDHLSDATLWRLSASRLRVELLKRLFPDGEDAKPPLRRLRAQSYLLNTLALAHNYGGEPGRSPPFFKRALKIEEQAKNSDGLAVVLANLMEAILLTGQIREAERAIRQALLIWKRSNHRFDEGYALLMIGKALASRGEIFQSQIALHRAISLFTALSSPNGESYSSAVLTQLFLWRGYRTETLKLSQRSSDSACKQRHERTIIRASRLCGEAALSFGELADAEERLHDALTRARAVNYVEEELPALNALAELHRKRQQFAPARDLLEQVWGLAERGPYQLWHADALNVLAQIERDQGNRDAAIAAATKAYTLAWCDGPPYAYHFGLINARKLLQELGAPEPQLAPFDESKFEPMPEVELNPKDEFWVDPDKLDDL